MIFSRSSRKIWEVLKNVTRSAMDRAPAFMNANYSSLSGAIAGGLEAVAIWPMEMIKTNLQCRRKLFKAGSLEMYAFWRTSTKKQKIQIFFYCRMLFLS